MKSAMRLRKAGPGKKAFILLVQCVLTAYALLILYPLFHMVMSSLKSPRDIMLDAFSLPQRVSWANYALVWSGKCFGVYFLNSLLITGGSMPVAYTHLDVYKRQPETHSDGVFSQ